MRFVDPPSWPSYTKYLDRYCNVHTNTWGGVTILGLRPGTRDELFGFLTRT